MPKWPNMRWGAVTNMQPTMANLKYLAKIMPSDQKWHTLFAEPDAVHIDNHTIRKKTMESMT